jgi:hypothetical protein
MVGSFLGSGSGSGSWESLEKRLDLETSQEREGGVQYEEGGVYMGG